MNAAKEEEHVACYHCGEDCDGSIVFNTHRFCCNGCKTVFELLDENNLGTYYTMNSGPGTSLKKEFSPGKWDYLDDEDVKRKLINFSDENSSRVTFYLPQIHCSSCIFLLENIYKFKNGINRSVVNFLKREVNITYNHHKLSLKDVAAALSSLGYQPSIHLNDLDHKQKEHHLRRYYLRIGIAFFAFGNMMLLSFPEYLGLNVLAESPFRRFLGYLNFLLALPVLLYCALEFFTSAWNAVKQRTLNMDFPIALGIATLFIRSSYEVFSHTGAGYFDTLGSLVLLMLIGRLFQNKTYDTLSFERDYKSYFPIAVTILNQDKERVIPITKLRVGDRLLIRNGELIPADSILIKGRANIDYSFVTGEAAPVSKQSRAIIFAGGKHLGSTVELEVIKEVSQSYLTGLWNDAAFSKASNENISSLATTISKWFTPAVILIAIAAALYWWNTDVRRALNAFTSVLIITCPCALALSSPFTLGNILRLLSRGKIYLKNAFVIEKLAKINAIVFDKTGTITDLEETKIEYVAIDDEKEITSNLVTGPETLSDYELSLVKSLVYHSSHPLSRKINDWLSNKKIIPTEDFKEIEGQGIEGWIDENCVRIGSKKYLYNDGHLLSSQGEFNLASKVYVGINGKVKGYFLVKNEYRKGFVSLISELKKKFEIYILSGDNDSEKNYLRQFVDEKNLIFYQQPGDKLGFIKKLQQQNRHVMMVGDGLNDAGALRQSDAGIAISNNINNFSPACDGIMEASQFENISSLLNYSRDGVRIIKTSFAISLLYNSVGIYFALQGTMSPVIAAILMPFSSVTILVFTTLFSTLAGRKRGF